MTARVLITLRTLRLRVKVKVTVSWSGRAWEEGEREGGGVAAPVGGKGEAAIGRGRGAA